MELDKEIEKGIEDLARVFTDPIIVWPSSWNETLPETLKNEVTMQRLLQLLTKEEGLATYAEVTTYMYALTLDHPIDHDWSEIIGAFDIEILPDNLVGVTVATGGAGAYGGDTELLSAVSRDNPFRIVGHILDPDAAPIEWYQVRFSDDGGANFFEVVQFITDRKEGAAAPSGTEHIFNAGTRISASARDVSGGDNVVIWLSIQEV